MSGFERHATVRTAAVPGWPPDDTEESVLGTNLHQGTIANLRWGLNEVAAGLRPAGGPDPWQALSQTAITGLRRWDGTPYTVLPDVFVHRGPIDDRRPSLALGRDGPPLVVAEVLSPATYESDLDLDYGKGHSYARAGVAEYLLLDPTGEYLPQQVQGWQLEGDVYVPRPPDRAGRWRSAAIGVAVGFDGARVVVYAPDGQRQPREGEVGRELAQQRDELGRQREENARLREEIAALRRRIDEGRQP